MEYTPCASWQLEGGYVPWPLNIKKTKKLIRYISKARGRVCDFSYLGYYNLQIAISTLNGLQTNAATLDIVRRQKATHRVSEYNRRHQMQRYLHRVGIELADLERLNAIHVSGTKGKVTNHNNYAAV